MSRNLRRSVILTLILLCAALPALNAFGIQLLYYYKISGNIDFENLSVFFENLIHFLNAAALFSGYAVAVYSVFSNGIRKSLSSLSILCASYLIQYAGGIFITAMTTVSSLQTYEYLLLYSLFNFLTDLLLLVIVCAITIAVKKVVRGKDSPDYASSGVFSLKQPLKLTFLICSLMYSAINMAKTISETVSLLKLYGAPRDISEFFVLSSPFLADIIYFFVFYFVMLALGQIFSKAERKDRVSD